MFLNSQYSNLANRVDAKTFGAYVDLTQYNSSSKLYTVPNDGYVSIYVDSPVTTNAKVFVRQSGTDLFSVGAAGNGSSYGRNAFYVKKGMTIYTTSEGNGFKSVIYRPLS